MSERTIQSRAFGLRRGLVIHRPAVVASALLLSLLLGSPLQPTASQPLPPQVLQQNATVLARGTLNGLRVQTTPVRIKGLALTQKSSVALAAQCGALAAFEPLGLQQGQLRLLRPRRRAVLGADAADDVSGG